MKSAQPYLFLIIYLTIITMLRWNWNLELIWLWMGGIAGFYFIYLDRLIHVFMIKPQEHLSEHVRHHLKAGRYQDMMYLLNTRSEEQRHLLTRSALFIAVWIPLTIFVLSSTGSQFASAMVMTIALRLLVDIYQDWHDQSKLRAWLFWQIKRPVTQAETKVAVWSLVAFFVIFSVWFI